MGGGHNANSLLKALAIALVLVIFIFLPSTNSLAETTVWLGDANGDTEMTVGAGEYFDVYLWIEDVTELAGFECHITKSGPATWGPTASVGSWFGTDHTMTQNSGNPAFRSQVLEDPTDLTGSGDLAVFHLYATEEGTVAISVTGDTFVLGNSDAARIDVDLPLTLSVNVLSGEGIMGGGCLIVEQGASALDLDVTSWTFSVQSTPNASVVVTGTAAGTTDYTTSIADGTEVSLTAPADSGIYHFHRWTIDGAYQRALARSVSLTISHDTTVVAVYGIVRYVGAGESYTNIQSAINASSDGQMVVVRDGTYRGTGNYDIDFMGKAITVCSENGSAACLIECAPYDGSRNGKGFLFGMHDIKETNTSVLQGFGIYNASASNFDSWGYLLDPWDRIGVITCFESSPMILDNEICNNLGELLYGIYCYNSPSILIDDNNVHDNIYIGIVVDGLGFVPGATITNNIVTNHNNCSGIQIGAGTAIVSGNYIADNQSTSGGGLGVSCTQAEISNNVFVCNIASSYGSSPGGQLAVFSTPVANIDHNLFLGRHPGTPEERICVASTGGAIYVGDCDSGVCITNNTIAYHIAETSGGGLRCSDSSPTITNNWFYGNQARGHYSFEDSSYAYGGGAIAITKRNYSTGNPSPHIANNVFSGNSVLDLGVFDFQGDGGAINCGPGTKPEIINNTFYANRCIATFSQAGSIYCFGTVSGTTVRNCVLWNNQCGYGSQVWDKEVRLASGAILDMDYNDVKGGRSGIVEDGGTLTWGTNNISSDPLLSRPGSWSPDPIQPDSRLDDLWSEVSTDNVDYHESATRGRWDPVLNGGKWVSTDLLRSPCIDAGDPASAFDQEPLPNGSRVNIGAFGNTSQASMQCAAIPGDCNFDCKVNILDIIIVRSLLNQGVYINDNWKADVVMDGKINILDMIKVRLYLNTMCPGL